MNIGIFLEVQKNNIISVGLELIGETMKIMGNRPYNIHGIIIIPESKLLDIDLREVKNYLDEILIYVYEDRYLTTEHYKEAVSYYVESKKPQILLLGATHLGRSFAPRVAARFKTGITADCTEIKYSEKYGLIQIRPAFGEEVLAEIITPNTLPQMATIRPGIMDPPYEMGRKDPKIIINKKSLVKGNLTIVDRCEKEKETRLDQSKIVVIAGNAIKEKEDLLLIEKLAKDLGGEFGVTRPLVAGGLAPYSRQVGVSGTILSASIVLLLGVSGSNQTLTGIRKAKKIIAINNDPDASIFKKVDIGIVDDWKDFVIDILNKRGQGK